MALDIAPLILSDQNGLLVLNKPYDIPTSGKNLDDDDAVQFWAMDHFKTMIWAVHQLDADTTGINLFVKEKKLVPIYQNALADDRSKKVYLALIHGIPEWDSIDCFEPIGKIDPRSLGVLPEGKSAHSRFHLRGRGEGVSLVEVELFTGRTHQIRIHLNHLGFPLVGEEWYTDRPIREHHRQLLHAWKVELHGTVERTFTAPLYPDFLASMHRFGIDSKEFELSEQE